MSVNTIIDLTGTGRIVDKYLPNPYPNITGGGGVLTPSYEVIDQTELNISGDKDYTVIKRTDTSSSTFDDTINWTLDTTGITEGQVKTLINGTDTAYTFYSAGGAVEFNGNVLGTLELGNKVYIYGAFTSLYGDTRYNRICRWDKTTKTFDPPITGSNEFTTGQINSVVYRASTNELYVAGTILTPSFGGFLVRYNVGTGVWSDVNSRPNASITKIFGDGINEYYIIGTFTSPSRGIAVLTFPTRDTVALTNGGMNDGSGRDALMISDDIWVVGGFTSVGTAPVAVTRIARYNTTTNTWFATSTGPSSNEIFGLDYDDSNNRLYLCGNFTEANGNTNCRFTMYYDITGNTFNALSSGGFTGQNNVTAVKIYKGVVWFCGNVFVAIGGKQNQSNIIYWNPNTGLYSMRGFIPSATVSGFNVNSDNELVVYGTFSAWQTFIGGSVSRVYTYNPDKVVRIQVNSTQTRNYSIIDLSLEGQSIELTYNSTKGWITAGFNFWLVTDSNPYAIEYDGT